MPRTYLPESLTVEAFEAVEPYYRELIARTISSPADLEKWLADFSELTAVTDEAASRLYIARTCNTDDAAADAAYLRFIETIEPRIKPLYFDLQKKLIASPHLSSLTTPGLAILARRWKTDIDLYRPENIPLETQLARLSTDYDRIAGAMTVDLDGAELTFPQAQRRLEEPDRALRERAWRAISDRRLQDRAALDDLFDRMLKLRVQIAANAGKPDFRDYQFARYHRFDYTPADCFAFHEAIEKHVVPVVRKLDDDRARTLGLPACRPWDLDVDLTGKPPLRPFGESDVDRLVAGTREIFARLSPALAREFDSLKAHGNLDLASRRGKAPGGYQMSLDESRQPFIFMNAAGTHGDVEVLLHEAGHAFHALASFQHDLVFVRSAPIEFCEVASMAMELLAADHLELFYPNPADVSRAWKKQVESVLRLLPWVATVDAFQHWVYTHPDHTHAQRDAAWLDLRSRFHGNVDYTGLEDAHAAFWQHKLHIFQIPFYYIEYGIAQLGALQLWLRARHDPAQTLANYRYALSLGNTRPLPDLFSAAGAVFDLSEKTVGPLVAALTDELAT